MRDHGPKPNTTLGRRPSRAPKAAPFRCDACHAVLLSTAELAQFSKAQLFALLAHNAPQSQAEAYRHRMVRERWSFAEQAKRIA